MKNKVITLLIMTSLVFSLVACGNNKGKDEKEISTKIESTEEIIQEDESSFEIEDTTEISEEVIDDVTDENTSEQDKVLSADQEDTSAKPDYTISEVNETLYATTAVNVRNYPGVEGDKIGSLEYSQSITRTGIVDNGWSQIDYNGSIAFVKSDYLTPEKPQPKPEPANQNEQTSDNNASTSEEEVVSVQTNGSYNQSAAQEVLNICNTLRAQNGLSPLSWSGALEEAAKIRAAEASVCWSHTRPDGSQWYTVSSATYGENLAKNYGTAQEAVNAWMESPTHRANILDGEFTQLGVAFYITPDGKWYWAQEFAY